MIPAMDSVMRGIFSLLAFAGIACGNDTSVNAGGSNPQPVGEFKGDESVVRMVSEKIDITFGKKISKVHCRFVFRSTKAKGDAKQILGFPDLVGEQDSGPIRSMITKIDGVEVKGKVESGYFTNEDFIPRGALGKPPHADMVITEASYHTVSVTFPPDKDVIVERIYTVDNGGSVEGNTTFGYTTLTGAIWNGTIGKAEFTVTLDGWTIDDLVFEDGPQKVPPLSQYVYSSPNKSEWKIESPTKLSLVWENFEPAVHKTRRGIFLTTWNQRPQ
jgi:hypothetical protein